MKELLSKIIMPVPILLFFLLGSVIFYKLKRKRWAIIMLLITVVWFLIITTPFIPGIMIKSLENRYSPIIEVANTEPIAKIDIMILGGGHIDDLRLPPNDQLSCTAKGRLMEGIRLYYQFPDARLVLSGFAGKSTISQAEVLAQTAISLGIMPDKIIILKTTYNTFDEARTYGTSFGNNKTLMLITDAVHMPRAMMLFKRQGLFPIPAPTNYILKKGSRKNPWRWIPSFGNISIMKVAIHEYAGILWAKMRYK